MRTQNDVYEEWEMKWGEVYGYRPSRATRCPRVVAGKRYLAAGYPNGDCICERHRFDHRAMWLDGCGRHVFTCEPYELDGESFADMLADLHALGLAVFVTGRALWHPTAFVVIVEHDDDHRHPYAQGRGLVRIPNV